MNRYDGHMINIIIDPWYDENRLKANFDFFGCTQPNVLILANPFVDLEQNIQPIGFNFVPENLYNTRYGLARLATSL